MYRDFKIANKRTASVKIRVNHTYYKFEKNVSMSKYDCVETSTDLSHSVQAVELWCGEASY